jgi:hypothetical protein
LTKKNGFGFLWLAGHNLHQQCSQGGHGQCRVQHDSATQVWKGPDEEATGNGRRRPVGNRPNALFLINPTVQDCLAEMNMKTILQSPYLLVMAPADCFLFARVKAELAAISVTQKPLQMTWDEVQWTIAEEDFVATLRWWKEWCKKCVWIGNGFVEKLPDTKFF